MSPVVHIHSSTLNLIICLKSAALLKPWISLRWCVLVVVFYPCHSRMSLHSEPIHTCPVWDAEKHLIGMKSEAVYCSGHREGNDCASVLSLYICIALPWFYPSLSPTWQIQLSVRYVLPRRDELLHRLLKILQTGEPQYPPAFICTPGMTSQTNVATVENWQPISLLFALSLPLPPHTEFAIPLRISAPPRCDSPHNWMRARIQENDVRRLNKTE